MDYKFMENRDPWYWTTAEGSETLNLLIGFESTFREKLQWLEEAENLSLVFEKNRKEGLHSAAQQPKP